MKLVRSHFIAGTLAALLFNGCGSEDLQMAGAGQQKMSSSAEGMALVDDSLEQPDGAASFSSACQDPEKQEIVQQALIDGDYETWRETLASTDRQPKILEKIGEESFPLFAEAYQLALEGKIEEANDLRSQLGLRDIGDRGRDRMKEGGQCDGSGKGQGMKKQKRKGRNR